MIDTDRAGAIGYSFDGYNTLAISGARIDPEHYLAQCPHPDATTRRFCHPCPPLTASRQTHWDEFSAHAGEAITASEDGLWQPMTDARIRVVMPMAGEGWWLFGERGLAAVDRPALFLAGTQDELYPENAQIFEPWGRPTRHSSPLSVATTCWFSTRRCGPAWPISPPPFLATTSRGARTWAFTFQRILSASRTTWPGECTRANDGAARRLGSKACAGSALAEAPSGQPDILPGEAAARIEQVNHKGKEDQSCHWKK